MTTITHHGAVTGVTGSCHQLTLQNGDAILIDCGMFQGAESAGREQGGLPINFSISCIKALIITHCHIDHVGRLPWLLAAGFRGPIYTSQATAQLLPLVIEDALKIGVSRDKKIIRRILSVLTKHLQPQPYNQWVDIFETKAGIKPSLKTMPKPQVKVKFRPAGHILGSAYIEIDVKPKAKTASERIVFSGDLGAPYTPLLPAPKAPYKADKLVIESTYGDKRHQGRKDRARQLKKILATSLKNGGTVLIPAFSIGRTQELLYEIENIIYRGGKRWQQLDVIIDSPLAAKFTRHYRQLKNLWDKEARQRLKAGRHPLDFEQLITINGHTDHIKLVQHLKQTGRPAVVIAASGMCAGGRITNYLKALLPDSRTDILFVGYQAKGTPGRNIQHYGPAGGYVVLDGDTINIRAGVHTLSGYSAHADQADLIKFVKRMRKKPKEIRLVHGDAEAKQILKSKLAMIVPDATILIPSI